MRKPIQIIALWSLAFSLFMPVNASNITGRGTLVTNDETGIVDTNLYEFLKTKANHDQLYSNDLAEIEELTITNYEYDIASINGLRHLQMPKLKVLNIAVDTMDSLDDILVFTSLEELNLYQIGMDKLPSRINLLYNLKSLQIEGGKLQELPASLYDIITLQSLVLKDIPITGLSGQIAKLMYLEELIMDHVPLTTIPVEIYQLNSLKHLEMNGMNLSGISAQIEQLVRLEVLRLEDNVFASAPEELFDLLNLQYLSLRNNKITNINPQIQSLHRLRELDLSNNTLTTLPIEMINLPNLKTLELANNAWDCLPSEFKYLSLTGISNIFDHYRIKVCGAAETTPTTTIRTPVIQIQDDVVENLGRTNRDVIVVSDQPVNFSINDVSNMVRDQALAFSMEGTYKVMGTNQFGVTSNTITFTIDKTRPFIKITDNANELGIYHIDVAIDANEEGYYIVNGVRQGSPSRLLMLSEEQAYTVSFIDLAGNESNVLDFVLQTKTDENPVVPNSNRTMMYLLFAVFALAMGGGTYLFLKKGMSPEEERE